ncbi:MAG: HipA domain-containing protein [Defluviitaleaceae bacterium]|nr:HipA domain-containing protein [Defluviitaleaceae bacterium]
MYKLMHKHTLVLEIRDGEVRIYNCEKLPFDLRHKGTVDYADWLEWLNRRLSHLQRTYMNQLYIQRRIGRDPSRIIVDSAGISPIDCFWITKDSLNHTWESLSALKDISLETAMVTLFGELNEEAMYKPPSDHISIFTTKGAFKKAVYREHILKFGDNAIYEVVGYKLGYRLGVNVAVAEEFKDGIVACKLFTNEAVSMVHARELLYPAGRETEDNWFSDSMAYFKHSEKITSELELLFMYNYMIANDDLHDENFGFLYDSETFEIFGVAPAYDFNSAFIPWENVKTYDPFVIENLGTWAKNQRNFINGLAELKSALDNVHQLSDKQKQMIISRSNYLCGL